MDSVECAILGHGVRPVRLKWREGQPARKGLKQKPATIARATTYLSGRETLLRTQDATALALQTSPCTDLSPGRAVEGFVGEVVVVDCVECFVLGHILLLNG